MRHISFLVLALLTALFAAPAAASASTANGYRMVDLGTLAGTHSSAEAINDHGQVVGYSGTAAGPTHAVLWSGGRMTDLGALGGGYSVALDINDRGQVIGYSTDADGAGHAVLWSGGRITDLGRSCVAEAINDKGYVVGSCDGLPVLWSNGQRVNLTGRGLPAGSTVRDIDGKGRLVGGHPTAGGGFHAYRWSGGTVTDLGALAHDFSEAHAMNERGQVAGWSNSPSGFAHAFFWSGGPMIDIGTLGGWYSQAFAVGKHGEVVGTSDLADGHLRAFLWRAGAMMDLGAVFGGGMNGSRAADINDRGVVAGSSDVGPFETHAVLWIPRR